MLLPLKSALPSPIAGLPDELLVDIVRHAVTEDHGIRIDEVWRTKNRLILPFNHTQKPREVAEDEFMRMNTITLDLTAPDSGGHILLRNKRLFARPFIADIEHLHLTLDLLIEGGHFYDIDELMKSCWRETDVIDHTLRILSNVFPKLKTLEVQVHNPDAMTGLWGMHGDRLVEEDISYHVDDRYHMLGCPQFEAYKKMERLLLMQKVMMLVGAVSAPRLRKKTVTFDQERSNSHVPTTVLDKNTPGSIPDPSDLIDKPTVAQKARAGLLFCDILQRPQSVIEAGMSQPQVKESFSRAELETMYASEVGRADREWLEKILKLPRVVVKMPH